MKQLIALLGLAGIALALSKRSTIASPTSQPKFVNEEGQPLGSLGTPLQEFVKPSLSGWYKTSINEAYIQPNPADMTRIYAPRVYIVNPVLGEEKWVQGAEYLSLPDLGFRTNEDASAFYGVAPSNRNISITSTNFQTNANVTPPYITQQLAPLKAVADQYLRPWG